LATSLAGLGEVACASGEVQTAQQYFQQALQITSEMQFVPLTLSILSGVGELLLQIGQTERASELLALALYHPASDHETKARTQQRIAHYRSNLSSEDFDIATQRGASSDLKNVITTVLAVLAAFGKDEGGRMKDETKGTTFHPSSSPGAPRSAVPHPLVDPLTPRELEVLRLITAGLTNQQIAAQLVISVGTAKFYTSQIYSKLNVSSRTQAVARARELNLLT
jgi:ATP/maltotriose-dependent transcriptional regulator MalT